MPLYLIRSNDRRHLKERTCHFDMGYEDNPPSSQCDIFICKQKVSFTLPLVEVIISQFSSPKKY